MMPWENIYNPYNYLFEHKLKKKRAKTTVVKDIYKMSVY
jgi:hypothetical protein